MDHPNILKFKLKLKCASQLLSVQCIVKRDFLAMICDFPFFIGGGVLQKLILYEITKMSVIYCLKGLLTWNIEVRGVDVKLVSPTCTSLGEIIYNLF